MRLIASEPFKGARARALSRAEVVEIYPVRAALEEVAARSATVRLGGEVSELEAEFEAMLHAAERGDLHEQVRRDVEFHRLIVEASGNQTLLDVWRSLRIEARTLTAFFKADIDLRDLAETHRPVLEALAGRDPEEAGRVLRRHVELFGELIRMGEDA